MPAPLQDFLRMVGSGYGVLSDEMLAQFGGKDAMLAALQKYDPNAHATTTEQYGGEGGSGPLGTRFDFDAGKMPKTAKGEDFYTVRATGSGDSHLINKNAAYDDPNYGTVANSKYFNMKDDPLWVKLAPLLVSIAAPAAGGALAGMGIGGAGLTAAATGSGLGAASSLPAWATNLIGKAPNIARTVAGGNFDPLQMLLQYAAGPAANAAGIDPNLVKTGLTLGNLARKR